MLKGENELGGLNDLITNRFRNEVFHEFGKINVQSCLGDNVDHSLSDFFCLGSLGVAGFLYLSLLLSGESDAEASQDEAVLGFHLAGGFNKVLPLFDELAKFISGDVHSIEAGSNVFTLSVFNEKSDLSPKVKDVIENIF